jgi:hypothetical protein
MRIDARAYESFRAIAADNLARQERRVARRARIEESQRIGKSNRRRLDAANRRRMAS